MAYDLHLGLIGDNIANSRSPRLHELAGEQNGMVVQYDRLVPRQMQMDFDTLFDWVARSDIRGINVTYPYKMLAVPKVTIEDPLVAAMGAVNTVRFDADGPRGFNTDYSGFMAGYRAVRGEAAPGPTCVIGCGGVGRAIAFGLVGLGCKRIKLMDILPERADALAEALAPFGVDVTTHAIHAEAIEGCSGLTNGTPVGMIGHEGTVFDPALIGSAQWVFDAVYTPAQTQFLSDAADAGLQIVSGVDLFFWQGVHAWQIFSGKPLDQALLKESLAL
ncbi:shikimate dehydrogenase [Sinirhodobacter sp. WL0062]|uniref:Shikimate dehydrogenase n=1 Tax=Rhodobacter flavimaris TaxID=2907145 RepID=A0ABS8YT91_9RHOB|nr:shikimate dehydrogenase [Sinirhodobacter sp. WL0062]MCE5973079.1 shikimate dehydrogenase [Sinirhodobacter sp. WL0062]